MSPTRRDMLRAGGAGILLAGLPAAQALAMPDVLRRRYMIMHSGGVAGTAFAAAAARKLDEHADAYSVQRVILSGDLRIAFGQLKNAMPAPRSRLLAFVQSHHAVFLNRMLMGSQARLVGHNAGGVDFSTAAGTEAAWPTALGGALALASMERNTDADARMGIRRDGVSGDGESWELLIADL